MVIFKSVFNLHITVFLSCKLKKVNNVKKISTNPISATINQ